MTKLKTAHLAVLLVVLFVAGLALLHLWLFFRRPLLSRLAIALLVLAALAFVSIAIRDRRLPDAVVLPEELTVRSGPGASSAGPPRGSDASRRDSTMRAIR